MRRWSAKRKSTSLPADWVVDLGGREAMVVAESEETRFEVAALERRAGFVLGEDAREALGSAVAGVGSCHGIEGRVVGQLEDLRLVEQALEAAALEGGGEVEDGAGGSGDGDPVAGCDLFPTGRPRPVNRQTGPLHAAGATRDVDVDDRRRASAQVPQRSGARVAQRGAGTAARTAAIQRPRA